MVVLVAGASGMIGRELCRQLECGGDTVMRLVRRRPQAENEIAWTPSAHIIDDTVMDRVDAVVNLSGTSLGRVPWTAAYKREIARSRIQATRPLTDAMAVAARLIRLALGDASTEMLLCDQNVSSRLLTDDGFRFRHETVDQAVAWLLER